MTPEQRQNLARLADELLAQADRIRPQFDMGDFLEYEEDALSLSDARTQIAARYSCGAIGCVIGWAPVLIDELSAESETWRDYSERVFGIRHDWGRADAAWEWLFSDTWRHTDNTPEGAAHRIRHYLEHGLPVDWRDQVHGRAALCYGPARKEDR